MASWSQKNRRCAKPVQLLADPPNTFHNHHSPQEIEKFSCGIFYRYLKQQTIIERGRGVLKSPYLREATKEISFSSFMDIQYFFCKRNWV